MNNDKQKILEYIEKNRPDFSGMMRYEHIWDGEYLGGAIMLMESTKEDIPLLYGKCIQVMQTLSRLDMPYGMVLAGMVHMWLSAAFEPESTSKKEIEECTKYYDKALDLLQPLFPPDTADLMYSLPFPLFLESRKDGEGFLEKLEGLEFEEETIVMAEAIAELRIKCTEKLWGLDKKSGRKEYLDEEEFFLIITEGFTRQMEDERTYKRYWELQNLAKELYNSYYLDKEENALYQVNDFACWRLDKGNPLWYDYDGEPDFANEDKYEKMHQGKAEALEDSWNEEVLVKE